MNFPHRVFVDFGEKTGIKLLHKTPAGETARAWVAYNEPKAERVPMISVSEHEFEVSKLKTEISKLKQEVSSQKAKLEWEKQQASRLYRERVEWHENYVAENTKHVHDRSAMRDALNAVDEIEKETWHEDGNQYERINSKAAYAADRLRERLGAG